MDPKITTPRGTVDILPSEISAWTFVEGVARGLFSRYGYREIRTPVFEDVGLFRRSLGDTTEVVNKQLLEVRSQRADGPEAPFALRPEGTAPVVRAYNEKNLGREEYLSKFFYMGPMFRGERPQRGRLRQFHQIGVEAIGRGADHPLVDAEIITLAVDLLKSLGVHGFRLQINSLGTKEDKAAFSEWLRASLKDKVQGLSETARDQYERNVFRLLDSKDPACQEVIRGLEIGQKHLSQGGREYFDEVRRNLDALGIAYEVSPRLVRGLDYYTHTVFEITCDKLGAQDAIGAGGRYNGLIEQLGGGDPRLGKPFGAIGFAFGIERILLALEGQAFPTRDGLEVFVIAGSAALAHEAFLLVQKLRAEGIRADMDHAARPFKKQIEEADRREARFAVILGEEEARAGQVAIKNMTTGDQVVISRNDIVSRVREKCGRCSG